MPKLARELSAIEVGRLKAEGTHAVGGVPGLMLQVTGGSRSWLLRFVVGADRRRMGLGAFPAVTLAQARDKARAARALLDRGIDPIEERHDQHRQAEALRRKALTFSKACEKYIALREAEWDNPKHRQQWENSLSQYAEPIMGTVDVADVDQTMVLRVLEPIWRTKTETASRLRGRIEQVLDWATAHGHREGTNPARWRGHLDKLLARPSKIAAVVRHGAVPVADVPAVVAKIAASPGLGAKALMFQLLTAARSGEVRGATWAEIDLDKMAWSIPAERMKARKPHRVPLSIQGAQVLKELPRIEGCDLVFPSTRMTPLSDMTITAVMRRLKLAAVPHGFRSTFRDWAAGHTHYPSEVVEMALAHAIESKVEAAYRRGELFVKRAPLMQEWANYCFPERN